MKTLFPNRGSLPGLLILFLFVSGPLLYAQDQVTLSNSDYHNHYSTEKWGNGSVVAGTLFDAATGHTYIHVLRLDDCANILWEEKFSFGSSQRCFDVCVISANLIAITGYVDEGLFVAHLDGSGTLRRRKRISYSGHESTGLSIVYSASQNALFVAGYSSPTDITSLASHKKGLLLRLDNVLNLVWIHEIEDSAPVMANNITEVPGIGLFITGKIDLWPYGGGLRMMFNYSGTRLWEQSTPDPNTNSFLVTDAVYDSNEDALYVISNREENHTFNLEKIMGISSGSPGIIWIKECGFPLTNSNLAAYDIEFHPGSTDLLVAGFIHGQPGSTGGSQWDMPTFLAEVDRNTAQIQWMKYQEVSNPNFENHDFDVFQADYISSTHSYIVSPDLLCILEPYKYQLIGYEDKGGANGSQGLNVILTDPSGNVNNALSCQEDYPYTPGNSVDIQYMTTTGNIPQAAMVAMIPTLESVTHTRSLDCENGMACGEACELFTYSLNTSGCFLYDFTAASITLPSGWSMGSYEWNWGDGTPNTTTSSSSVQHQFPSGNGCVSNVCLTITIYDASGNPIILNCCIEIQIQAILSQQCPSCAVSNPGGPFKKNPENGNQADSDLSLKIYPTIAENQITIDFGQTQDQASVVIYNMAGQAVLSSKTSGTAVWTLDIGTLPSGTYIVKTTSDLYGKEAKLIQVR